MTDARQSKADTPAPRSPRTQRTKTTPAVAGSATAVDVLEDTTPRAPTASRLLKEQGILAEAENHFAQFGFEGASLENIAAAIGISQIGRAHV